jgi:hypothetical protein
MYRERLSNSSLSLSLSLILRQIMQVMDHRALEVAVMEVVLPQPTHTPGDTPTEMQTVQAHTPDHTTTEMQTTQTVQTDTVCTVG